MVVCVFVGVGRRSVAMQNGKTKQNNACLPDGTLCSFGLVQEGKTLKAQQSFVNNRRQRPTKEKKKKKRARSRTHVFLSYIRGKVLTRCGSFP